MDSMRYDNFLSFKYILNVSHLQCTTTRPRDIEKRKWFSFNVSSKLHFHNIDVF